MFPGTTELAPIFPPVTGLPPKIGDPKLPPLLLRSTAPPILNGLGVIGGGVAAALRDMGEPVEMPKLGEPVREEGVDLV